MRKSHKEELFSAAFRLFILHGYDGVSFSDIEKATGMSRGAIFHYVDTKQDLFRQVVEMFVIDKQSIDMKIKYGKDTSLRDFIGAYAQGVKRTMKEVRQIIGEDVSMAAGSRAYLNIIQQVATQRSFQIFLSFTNSVWIESNRCGNRSLPAPLNVKRFSLK